MCGLASLPIVARFQSFASAGLDCFVRETVYLPPFTLQVSHYHSHTYITSRALPLCMCVFRYVRLGVYQKGYIRNQLEHRPDTVELFYPEGYPSRPIRSPISF